MENIEKKTFERERANGKGAICFHKNRKKKYEVQVTLGYIVDEKTNSAKRQVRSLGYFLTEKQALKALGEFMDTRVRIEKGPNGENGSRFVETITFAQLFEEYFKETIDLEKTNKNTINSYKAAFNAVPELHDKVFKSLYVADLRNAINNSGKNEPTVRKILVLFRQLYKYAAENKLCEYASAEQMSINDRTIVKTNDRERTGKLILREDIKRILEDKNNEDFVDTVKFLLYTGVRVREMLSLKKEDVNIEHWYIDIKGTKNKSSKRLVPIHPELREVVFKWYNKKNDSGYLFTTPYGQMIGYDNYRLRSWDEYFSRFETKYLPHDTRRTFKTMTGKCKCDENVIEKIMGHTLKKKMVNDYLLEELEWFTNELSKLKYMK